MNPAASLLELNTFAWLTQKRRETQMSLSLSDVPAKEWAKIRKQGFDFIWLMGVWKRSPKAQLLAQTHPNLIQAYDTLLPKWTPEDICGSPYAVYGYESDPFLGQGDVLAGTREAMKTAGLKLILDFVPNHLAFDHPWTLEDPALFVRGNEANRKEHPEWFFKTEKGVWLAHGRDPYFAPWIDTVQVNFFSARMRKRMTEELLKIAAVSDGVRCDMAMLGLNGIFSKVWNGVFTGTVPTLEFWEAVICGVKDRYPDFLFIAEAYWYTERPLIKAGFDFIYDKVFYDRLRAHDAQDLRMHLKAQDGLVDRMVRFIENHDEARAAKAFPGSWSRSAALAAALQPGIRFFHQGQAEGRTHHFPVQLSRWPEAKPDVALEAFYKMLWKELQTSVLTKGYWHLPEAKPAWEGEESFKGFFVSSWNLGREWRLGVMNLGETRGRARIPWPFAAESEEVCLKDLLTGTVYKRSAEALREEGLYVELDAGDAHFFKSFYADRF